MKWANNIQIDIIICEVTTDNKDKKYYSINFGMKRAYIISSN